MSFLSLDCEFDMRKPETFSDQMFLMEEVSQFMQEYQENWKNTKFIIIDFKKLY